MKILLTAPTQNEIAKYLLQPVSHDVLITGVGIAQTTMRLTKQLLHHHYDVVIQAGVAGAFNNSFVQLGDVVWVEKDAFGDLGVLDEQGFHSLQEMGFSNDPVWYFDENQQLPKIQLPTVKGITVNTISADNSRLTALLQKWQASIETMEGAAAAMVCHHKKVPFLQIRSISNWVGERNKDKWQLGMAIENLNNTLPYLMAALKSTMA